MNTEKGKRKYKNEKENKNDINEVNSKIKAVIFVQHMPYSKMAKRMRKKLDSLKKLGKFKSKLV